MVRLLKYTFEVMIRLVKLSIVIMIWPFLDHTPPEQHSAVTLDADLARIEKEDLLEALEIQQDTLREQTKIWEYETNRTDLSENKKMQYRTRIANTNVRIQKINSKVMKLRKEIENGNGNF